MVTIWTWNQVWLLKLQDLLEAFSACCAVPLSSGRVFSVFLLNTPTDKHLLYYCWMTK